MKLRDLFRRDKGRCHLCGQPVRRGEGTRDHLVPRSPGGKNGKLNIRLAHADCNQLRGASPLPAEQLRPTGRMRRLR
jgi:5-methylcytosine-specific restriction endonuclease McrA